MEKRTRLAIVSTHPIQYYAPWFASLHAGRRLDVKVFYLLEPPAEGLYDRGFGRDIRWDTPLLEGYPHEFVPNTSAAPGTATFFGLRNPGLAARIRDFAPDAVLVNGYAYLSLVRFILAWPRSAAPLVFRGDSHRIAAGRGLGRKLKDAAIARLFRRFSAFAYVGKANYRYFRAHGVPERDLFLAPHAVDNAKFFAAAPEARAEAREWRRELGIPERDLVVLFAGKFEEKKRPLDLLAAFREIAVADATLLFVGGGPLEQRLRAEARGAGKVVFAPFQNQSRMPRTYAACDLLVLPSYGQFETWGLAVNEAMCMGKPVVVSSHVGCAEDLVAPGETGLVFEAGSIASLAGALRSALGDRARLADWGAAARSRIGGFSYAEATRGLLDAVDGAMRKKA